MSPNIDDVWKRVDKRLDDMNVQTFAEQIAVVQARHHKREKELLKLLRRLDGHICHHPDCVSWDDDNYCDCAYPDLLKELADE